MPDRLIALALTALLLYPVTPAAGSSVDGLSQPQKLGEATMRWLGLPIYNAALYTQGSNQFSWTQPIALELEYLRSFPASQLTKSTLDELERIEGPRSDHSALIGKLGRCFRDVSKGDRLMAYSSTASKVSFSFNGGAACTVSHSGVRERFLGIWLSDSSRSAKLTRRLKGE